MDLERLRSEIPLPVYATIPLETKQEMSKGTVAVTYCDTPQKCRIEFGEDYFAEREKDRLLIMLHEFIHVKHLNNSLSRWHRKRQDYEAQLKQRFREILQSAPKEQLDRLDFWKQFAPHVFKCFYEIWAELYLKEKYPELFPKRMELEYRGVRRNFKIKRSEYPKGYGSNAKYPILVEMLKATYFRKIAAAKSTIGDQFNEICRGWRRELRRIVGEDKAKDCETLVDYLSDISAYPDSTVLEGRYMALIDRLLANESLQLH